MTVHHAWFTLQVMGQNTLASMVKKMFQEIGVEGKSNHSLRATGATRLFESNVPEKLIHERTGHKSVDALRLYERTSVDQQKSVSTLLCAPKKDTSALLCAPKKSEFQSPMTTQPPALTSHNNSALSATQTMFKDFNNCTFNITFNQK